jgi:lysozyme family protein
MWGSGNGGLKPNVILMQNFLKKKGYDPQGVDGVIGTNTINALNSYLSKTGKAGEKELYDAIWNNRVSQLRTYGTFYKHGQGWLNRMNDLYKSALTKATELIANNPIKTGLFSAFLIVGGLFLLGKKYAK